MQRCAIVASALLAVLLFASGPASAQTAAGTDEAADEARTSEKGSEKTTVEVGARAGITSFALWGSGVEDVSSRRTGSAFGLFLQVDFPGRFGAQIEGLLIGQGAEVFQAPQGPDNATLNYMEAPILLRVGVPEVGAGPFDLSFLAGPTIGYLTIPTITFSNPSLTQVGFAAGPEISVPAGAARLSLSLRYRTGITSTFEDITARNRGLSGTLGISF